MNNLFAQTVFSLFILAFFVTAVTLGLLFIQQQFEKALLNLLEESSPSPQELVSCSYMSAPYAYGDRY